MKNFNDTIGNLTRDLPACNAVILRYIEENIIKIDLENGAVVKRRGLYRTDSGGEGDVK
jgi:hypothetical protein